MVDDPWARWYVVIAERTTIELRQTSADGERCVFDLRVESSSVGQLTFISVEDPKFSISSGQVAIFAGMCIYVVVPPNQVSMFKINDVIHSAYRLEHVWCLVCETSVSFLDPSQSKTTHTWQHGEIIVRSWWSGNHLHIEDFEGQRYRFVDAAEGKALDAKEERSSGRSDCEG